MSLIDDTTPEGFFHMRIVPFKLRNLETGEHPGFPEPDASVGSYFEACPGADEMPETRSAAGHLVPVGHVDQKTVQDTLADYQWFTFLRAPVHRIVSLMNYWTQVAHEASHFWRDGSETDRQAYRLAWTGTFEEFLSADNEKIREQVHNTACRRITGEMQDGRSNAAYADLAFEKLRDEALFFGLQERYVLSLLQVPMLLNLPPCRIDLAAARNNMTTIKRLAVKDVRFVDQEVIGADILLYRKATKLFDARTHAMAQHFFADPLTGK